MRSKYELRLILNANPKSRARVEQGDYCLRENENGVDLNRNYRSHWKAVATYHLTLLQEIDPDHKRTNPGPFAFSERETQIVSDQLRTFNPHMFLSIHSGTLGLFAPWAYTQDLATENQENMVKVLSEVQSRHCP